MSILELKERTRVIFKNNFGKFIQVVLLHALFLSIIPLHIVIIATSNLDDGFLLGMIVLLFSLFPFFCFIIPNFNPCIIRSFRGTIYEIRNNPTIKSYKYITNIFKHYWKYFSIAFLTNSLWYVLMVVLFITFSFSFAFVGNLILQNSMIILVVYSPVIIAYIARNIYNLNYCFSTYIIHDNPLIQPPQAIKQSKELLKGNFKDLLYLKLSFIGWYLLLAVLVILLSNINLSILSTLLFFCGFELINAYQTLAIVEMYEDLKSKKVNSNNNFNINNLAYQNNQNNQNYQNNQSYQNYQNNVNYQKYNNRFDYQDPYNINDQNISNNAK